MTLEDGFTLSPDSVRQALKSLGFQSGEIEVVGSGRVIAQEGGFFIQFENHPDVALEMTPVAKQLSSSPQSQRLRFQVVDETEESFKLRIVRAEQQQ